MGAVLLPACVVVLDAPEPYGLLPDGALRPALLRGADEDEMGGEGEENG